MSERLVNSSKTGLSMRRRIASRATPGSAPAKMSGINERSERSRSRRRVLRLLLSLCWSRSQAEKNGAEQFGIDQFRPVRAIFAEPEQHFAGGGMFAQAPFERGAQFVLFAGFGEDFGIDDTSRALFPCMRWSARTVQRSPSAAGSAWRTRRSLAEGIFGRIAPRRGSSSTIKRSSVRSGLRAV